MLKRMIKAIQKTSHFLIKIGRKHLASAKFYGTGRKKKINRKKFILYLEPVRITINKRDIDEYLD